MSHNDSISYGGGDTSRIQQIHELHSDPVDHIHHCLSILKTLTDAIIRNAKEEHEPNVKSAMYGHL